MNRIRTVIDQAPSIVLIGCPVLVGTKQCAHDNPLHKGSHLPMPFIPRPLGTWDEPGLAASMARHPSGRAR